MKNLFFAYVQHQGWKRVVNLFQIVLPAIGVVFGVLILLTEDEKLGSAVSIFSFLVTAVLCFISWIGWVIIGFKDTNSTKIEEPNSLSEKHMTDIEQPKSVSEMNPTKIAPSISHVEKELPKKDISQLSQFQLNIKSFVLLIKWGLIYIPIFFVCYVLLYWIFVWSSGLMYLTGFCAFSAFLLSRFIGKQIIKKYFPHLN